MVSEAPLSFDELQALITGSRADLSKRLAQIADYVLQNPNRIALETAATIAADCGVPPSALIRFANAFGFSGFSQLQQLYKERLHRHSSTYTERFRETLKHADHAQSLSDTPQLLETVIAANQSSVDQLRSPEFSHAIDKAVALLNHAKTVHVMGVRRSFSMASYAVYALRQSQKPAVLLSDAGAMFIEQSNLMQPETDVLVAFTFSPYAEETQRVIAQANMNGVATILITDTQNTELESTANVAFQVEELAVGGVRTLSASFSLLQALLMALTVSTNQA